MFYRILIKSLIWKSSEFGKVPNLEKFRIWKSSEFGITIIFGRGKSWPGCVEWAVPAVYVFYVCGQITSPKVGRYVHDVMKYGHCSAVMYA